VERDQLTVRHLLDLMPIDPTNVTLCTDAWTPPPTPVTYIGLEPPEGLHPDSHIITLKNLRDLIPD
jgi:hypothetical protein